MFLFFIEFINLYICGKVLFLNSNELYFFFMNLKLCVIFLSFKLDIIVFNVGICFYFNNIKMEIKL